MKKQKYLLATLLAAMFSSNLYASPETKTDTEIKTQETTAESNTQKQDTSDANAAAKKEQSNQTKKTTVEYVLPWDTVLTHKAAIKYKEDTNKDSPAKVFTAKIGFAQSGKQRLYFIDENLDTTSVCNKVSTKSDVITMTFNNKDIKMSRWCIAFANEANHFYYSYTPLLDDEHDNLVEVFKKATTPVVIKHNNNTFKFPVMGFTKEWKEVAKTKAQTAKETS